MIDNSLRNGWATRARLALPLAVFFGAVFLLVAAIKFHVMAASGRDFALARPLGAPVTSMFLSVIALFAARWFFGQRTAPLSKALLAVAVVLLPLMGLLGVISGAGSGDPKPLGGSLGLMLARAFGAFGPILGGVVLSALTLFGGYLARRIVARPATAPADPYSLLRRAQPVAGESPAPAPVGDEGVVSVRTMPGGGELFPENVELAVEPPEDNFEEAPEPVGSTTALLDEEEPAAVEPFYVPEEDEPPPPPRRIPLLAGVIDAPEAEEDVEVDDAHHDTAKNLFTQAITEEASMPRTTSADLDDDEDEESDLVARPAALPREEARAEASPPFRAEDERRAELTATAAAEEPAPSAASIAAEPVLPAASPEAAAEVQPDLFGAGIFAGAARSPIEDDEIEVAAVVDHRDAPAADALPEAEDDTPDVQSVRVIEVEETAPEIVRAPMIDDTEAVHDEYTWDDLADDDVPAESAAVAAEAVEPVAPMAETAPEATAEVPAEPAVEVEREIEPVGPTATLVTIQETLEAPAAAPEPDAAPAADEAPPPEADTPTSTRSRTPRRTTPRRRTHGGDETATLFGAPASGSNDAAASDTPPIAAETPAQETPAEPAVKAPRRRRERKADWAAWEEGSGTPRPAAPAADPSTSIPIAEAPRHRTGERPLFEGALEPHPDLLQRAISLVVEQDRCSVSLLQRELGVTFGEATSLIDRMFQQGIVGPYQPTGRREVLAGKNAEQQA